MATVAILGGGVAGMTAAHELAEQGYEVTVYEKNPQIPGGKARSLPVPGTGTGGRPDLPGEHGFRFFPGFYWHVPHTMKRIPYQSGSVFDNLVTVEQVELAQGGQRSFVAPLQQPETPDDLWLVLQDLDFLFHLPPDDVRQFAAVIWKLLVSCEERRFAEYEPIGWLTFCGANDPGRSAQYKKYMIGLSRTLVAARAEELSARTGGDTLIQLLFGSRGKRDRVLNGPTNDVWIGPWHQLLGQLGVDYRYGAQVTGIHCQGSHVTGVDVTGQATAVTADYYVAALPVEVFRQLVTPVMVAAAPSLKNLGQLQVRWMNGVMFYIDPDVSLVKGHTIYIDSPWALTSISQQQFWDVALTTFGNGLVRGILSVDVSNWDQEGIVYNKKARDCNQQEIRDEIWAQIMADLSDDQVKALGVSQVLEYFIDPDIEFKNGVVVGNAEPLLVNTAGSWDWRPEAATGIDNLFLAADYVRTATDLATMEGANEAARRAVNALVGRTVCHLEPLHEPVAFAPLRLADEALFAAGFDPVPFPDPSGLF
jgi:uncharacterized protein with NAD-binding domain and iron-sulfur cluster